MSGRDGRDGRPGIDGEDGDSAYQVAKREGFVGTKKEWLDSLHGKDGRDGADGKDGKQGERGLDGKAGVPGTNGRDGAPGVDGKDGKRGTRGAAGLDGNNGWTPILAAIEDGERVVHQIIRWAGGSGQEPERGLYIGNNGLVSRIEEAQNIRGPIGASRDRLVGVGGGMSQASVIALVESLTMEDFDQVPLPEQTAGVSAEVLLFSFDSAVHKVWVKLLASSADDLSAGRVRTDGVDPDADEGQPIDAGVPQPISVVTSEVRVFTPAGKTVNVTGYRRRV